MSCLSVLSISCSIVPTTPSSLFLYRILLDLHCEHSNKFCWLPLQRRALPPGPVSVSIRGIANHPVGKISKHFLPRLSRQVPQCQGEEEGEERGQCSVTLHWDRHWGRGSSGRTDDLRIRPSDPSWQAATIFDERKDFHGRIRKEKSEAVRVCFLL